MEALIYGAIFTVLSGFAYTYAIRMIISDINNENDKDRKD
jgi:hypothetical protein